MTSTKLSEPRRRRLSQWATTNAWKLAGLTAIVTFVGVFIAVSLSLLLRPTLSYFFPLLSDVDKHQPEGAILRIAFITATALLFATTFASVLHCHSLRLFARNPAHDSADGFAGLPAEPTRPDDALRLDISSPRDVHCQEIAALPKRRVPRLNTIQVLILVPICTTIVFSFLQYTGLAAVLSATVQRRHLIKLGVYVLSATWAVSMLFLVWYFLKLQSMPDRCPPPQPETLPEVDEQDSDVSTFTSPNARIVDRFRAWATWLIVILRPICLTGQVVCIIKIVGLWLALDTFSISNIHLVKIALLAALAFAEYTAAFFFAFFMTILAVDMRAKAVHPPDFPLQT